MSPHPVVAICRTLGVSRSSAYRGSRLRGPFYTKADDALVETHLRAILRTRGTYGHKRLTALVNQTYHTRYNRKRIRRVLRMLGLALPPRVRRPNGRPHRGRIIRDQSNERWSSDTLEIPCWNGEYVQLAFALDCHDRELLAWVAAARDLVADDIQVLMRTAVAHRFPRGRAEPLVQWLSDNGGPYTALATRWEAERWGLLPITTPVASPESNGMSEAWVNTFKRDYVAGMDCSCAETVLAALPAAIEDYNTTAPHSQLGYRSPRQYRAEQTPKEIQLAKS
jgi:transposase InsO family protein